jgi:hypothetical protein
MPLRIHLLPTSCVLIPLANGYFKHLCTYQLKFTPRHSSYHYDYNKEKIIHKENITFLGKKQNEKVLNFTMLMILSPLPLHCWCQPHPHTKNKTNIRLVPKVSHLHKPKPFPLLFHKSPNTQLSDERQSRRHF